MGTNQKLSLLIISYSLLGIISTILEAVSIIYFLFFTTSAQIIHTDYKMMYCRAVPPKNRELIGNWTGKFFGRYGYSPAVIRMSFQLHTDGHITNRWQLLYFMRGSSLVEYSTTDLYLYDFTSFRDEIRAVSDKIMIGRYWLTPMKEIRVIDSHRLNLLHFEKTTEGIRPALYYILERS